MIVVGPPRAQISSKWAPRTLPGLRRTSFSSCATNGDEEGLRRPESLESRALYPRGSNIDIASRPSDA
eukprot:9158207-Pyramimonas_sp.AAC.1